MQGGRPDSCTFQSERKAISTKRDFEETSSLLKRELQRLDREKVDDFRKAVQRYTSGMVKRQMGVVDAWKGYVTLLEALTQAGKRNPEAPAAAEG